MQPDTATGGDLLSAIDGVLAGERDPWANSANVAALLFGQLPEINWAGFYFLRGGGLVVGPFQGRVACVRIALGEGVCGAAAERRVPVVVRDVHEFPGHIACDAASNAEVVVPLQSGGRLIGVLDVDSPRVGRFDDSDARLLESVAARLAAACDWRLAGIDGFK